MSACLPLKYSTHTENCQLTERGKEPECTIYRLGTLTQARAPFNMKNLGQRASYELTWTAFQRELNKFAFSHVCSRVADCLTVLWMC